MPRPAKKKAKPRTFRVWAIMDGNRPVAAHVGTKEDAEQCACCGNEYPVEATLTIPPPPGDSGHE